MVDFRRVITALAVLALFAGLASAQVGATGQTQLTCNTNVTVTPALRGEGITEQTGDITITCTGGTAPVVGSQLSQVNFQIFYPGLVTSRLLGGGAGVSEALLLIDEPGATNLTGFGPSIPQTLCATPLSGCLAYAGFPSNGTTISPTLGAVATAGTSSPAANVYQGVVTGSSVTFFGIPVMPPTTTGSRVFRITNVRINATGLSGLSSTGGSQVTAGISISPASSLSISNSAPNVGFVQPSLTGSAAAQNFSQCNGSDGSVLTAITFTELFGTAFKTRVSAQTNTSYAGQNYPLAAPQNVPGALYNSESNFVFPISTGVIAGLADFGTRLKATFNNIPAGVTLSVATTNAAAPAVVGGSAANGGNAPYTGYAQLVSVAGVDAVSDGSTFTGIAGTAGFAPVTLVNGTGAAVWEVINTNPNTVESMSFNLSIVAPVGSAATVAGTGATVTLSYAPTATPGGASATLPIPRFNAASSTAANPILTITVCRTILLYPFITNQVGFDTGLTIANTSMDPFTTGSTATAPQTGSCTLNYYGGTTAAPLVPPAQGNTGTIGPGTVWANTLQTIAPTFQGYMFAVCNFQYAHGFAFISDVGAQKLAMGYLAIVIPDPGAYGSGTRKASPPCQGVLGCSNSGEQDAH